MNVLLNIKDISDNKEREEQWTAQIDTVLDRGRNTEILAYVPSILNDHDSHICTTLDYVLTYVAGYVARKGNRFCKDINNKNFICEECLKTLVLQPNDEIPERHKLIEIKTKGYLINPSIALFNLLSSLEKGVIEGTKCGEININTLFEIMELIDEEKNPITFLGCEKHNYEFTKNIICFYLITRMFFLVKQANKNDNTEKEKTKEKRKCSKLVHSNGPNVSNVDFQIKETNAIETVIQMNYGKRRKIGTNIRDN
ncbi:Tigger transposable element-derived-like protein [Temnothorax longispinosus]|uniref:Tigger transposable element-derived-like protein n=1 Tax=Temnothorax longispinosus TaxID=300112 RepID=A0A4S2KEL7_9HYME|nr:Tigger transposable element-derived-like protein [Temnothorax longispinosus]